MHLSERQAKRWFSGGAPLPRPVSCRVLEFWFEEPVDHLLGPPKFEIACNAITDVNAHVIPGACAHVIPQVVGPGDVLPGGLLLVVGDTPGPLVGSVAGAV
ncbi:MAG TPA: hypothetical protein VGL46_15155, partial [Pseudonocardiaceae bacterium]